MPDGPSTSPDIFRKGYPAFRIFPAEMQLVQTRMRFRVPFSVTIRAG
jgi:hypothetical protein